MKQSAICDQPRDGMGMAATWRHYCLRYTFPRPSMRGLKAKEWDGAVVRTVGGIDTNQRNASMKATI